MPGINPILSVKMTDINELPPDTTVIIHILGKCR
jgi:hypothetical protein